MESEKARHARIRAQLDRLKARYLHEDRVLRALFDAAGLDSPPAIIDPACLAPACAPTPLAAVRG
jgi:hypothetical protein